MEVSSVKTNGVATLSMAEEQSGALHKKMEGSG